jgi:thiamine biosynthesis protein ThiI
LYLLRYSEIGLKSPPVRSRWEKVLVANLRTALPGCKVRRTRGRIWLDGPVDEEKLGRVFGIVSFSPCQRCSLEDLDSFVLDYSERAGLKDAKTFALRLRRVGNHPFTSQEMTVELADLILERFPHLKVDLEEPEATVYVEIRDDDCYLFREVIKGAGGLPLGVEGDLVALLSGGIDSPVATWMMMKRGCRVIPIYVELEGISGPMALARARAVAERLRDYQPDLELKVIRDDFLLRSSEMLRRWGLERYTCLICKRRMYRLAESVAIDLGAKGIVTGESLGQVASQTLDNLFVLDDASSTLPIYRPLIGFDKVEIERIAREIGTFEPSIHPSEVCGAVPKKPATKARLDEVAEIEEDLRSIEGR